MGAQVPDPGHAVAAPAAHHVSFAGNQIRRMEVVDVGANLDDLSHELVTDGHGYRNRLLGPFVPIEDVHVRPADTRTENTDKHVVDADRWLGDVLEPQARMSMGFD